MIDPIIRFHLLKELKRKYVSSGNEINRIVNEMSVCKGLARVDIAVINGSLHGYEIKSSEDTLVRLDNQLRTYFKCFDYISVVTTEKHLSGVFVHCPENVGISEIISVGDKVKIIQRRKARKNKDVDAISILELLWKVELLKLANLNQLTQKINSKSKDYICNYIADNLNISKIQYFVRSLLKIREGWRSDL
jgi:hypothetical protein